MIFIYLLVGSIFTCIVSGIIVKILPDCFWHQKEAKINFITGIYLLGMFCFVVFAYKNSVLESMGIKFNDDKKDEKYFTAKQFRTYEGEVFNIDSMDTKLKIYYSKDRAFMMYKTVILK